VQERQLSSAGGHGGVGQNCSPVHFAGGRRGWSAYQPRKMWKPTYSGLWYLCFMIHRKHTKHAPGVPKAIAFGGTEVWDGEPMGLDAGEQ
jgi:hypothetical protein